VGTVRRRRRPPGRRSRIPYEGRRQSADGRDRPGKGSGRTAAGCAVRRASTPECAVREAPAHGAPQAGVQTAAKAKDSLSRGTEALAGYEDSQTARHPSGYGTRAGISAAGRRAGSRTNGIRGSRLQQPRIAQQMNRP